MIQECQDLILKRLGEIEGVTTVDAWQGDVEALASKPARLPALMVVYGGCEYGPKRVIGKNHWDADTAWLVVLLHKDLRGPRKALEGCYGIIESVRAKLAGYELAGYGDLEPVSEELLFEKNGLYAYGLNYRVALTVALD